MRFVIDKDIRQFLDGNIITLIDGIDVRQEELVDKKSEFFTQKFLKDSKGLPIMNEPVHNIMHRFIRLANSKGYTKYLVLGAFGHGKSLCRGNKVVMYDCSMKNIEDVKVNDIIMGPDSVPRKVLAIDKGKEQAYKIILKNKDSFTCNESHKIPFYISNRWRGYKKGDVHIGTIKEYLELPEWAKKNCWKIQKAQLNFSAQNIDFDPYIYGLWLGDGHCSGLSFTINDDDDEICEALSNWMDLSQFEIRVEEQKGNCTRYDFNKGPQNNVPYAELDFIKSSIIDGEKRIKKEYLNNTRERRLEILAGMIDTDGYLFDNCYEWSTKWRGLRDDFLFLCRSLGFSVSHRTKNINSTLYYVVIVSGYTDQIPCRVIRKQATERKQIKNPLVYGFDIEDIGEQDYYGIVLDGDHQYLQDDFTIHHNTEQLCTGWVMHRIAQNPNILCKIVHVSETEAVKRCRAIRDYITKDDDLHRIAPHLMPTAIWGSQRFIVKRSAMSKDGTVEAYGVLSTAIGGRANLLVFDDPQDLKTAVHEPSTRQKIEDTFKNIWLTRIIPQDSEVLVMMNKWHESLVFGDVLTPDGMKDISECQKDDLVYTSNGFQPVLKTDKAPYVGNVYKIIPWYLSGLEAEYTADHEIKTKDGYKYANALTTDDFLELPIYNSKKWFNDAISSYPSDYEYKGRGYKSKPSLPISVDEFEILLSSELTYKQISEKLNVSTSHVYYCARFYGLNNKRVNSLSINVFKDKQFWRIIGLWLAEGSLTYSTKKENREVIRFTFGDHEKSLINEVICFFNKYNIHCGLDYTDRSSCTLKVSSMQLAQWINFNFSEGSSNKKLPQWFFGLPEDLFFEFLIGYFDGDGCFNKDDWGTFRFSSISKSLLHGIQLNLLRFGYITSLFKCSQSEGLKQINFGFGEVEINCNVSYELRLDEKNKKFAFIKDDKLFVKIRNIQKRKYAGYVYDITTPTHDFCSSGYLVHNSDLAAVIKRNPVWSWMSIAVDETLGHLNYEDSFGRKKILPVWSLFNTDDLRMKVMEIGQREFDRGYRLVPYTDSDRSFPSFSKCCHFGVSPKAVVSEESNWIFIGGIDFASLKRPGTVLSVVAVHKKTGMKVPLAINRLRGTQELPALMVKYFRQFGVELFFAENNGVQDALIDMLVTMLGQDKFKRYGIKIEGFLTGKNKADPIHGLPSIEKEFDNQEWMFCFDHKPDPTVDGINDPWVTTYYEFSNHPFYETTDIVMSLWFAREGAKMYLRKSDGPNIY